MILLNCWYIGTKGKVEFSCGQFSILSLMLLFSNKRLSKGIDYLRKKMSESIAKIVIMCASLKMPELLKIC